MNTRERILAIKLLEKEKKEPEFFKEIKVEVVQVLKENKCKKKRRILT